MATQDLEKKIESLISPFLPEHSFKEVLRYSLFPCGKMFRAKLCLAIAKDSKLLTDAKLENDVYLYASAIEAHHTYSLVHDDLPCMDDDDMRRGKLSSHKKFSEEAAVLCGDALINISYQLISHIDKTLVIPELIRNFSELVGPRGLILGQVLDLDGENQDLQETIKLHILKTSNLITAALSGANILMDKTFDPKAITELGENMGVAFQLIDDLLELDENVSDREKSINPFIKFNMKDVLKILDNSIQKINEVLKNESLNSTKEIIDDYFCKMKLLVNQKEESIKKTLEISEIPVSAFR